MKMLPQQIPSDDSAELVYLKLFKAHVLWFFDVCYDLTVKEAHRGRRRSRGQIKGQRRRESR